MNRIKKEKLKRLKSIILIMEVSVIFGSSAIDKGTIERAKKIYNDMKYGIDYPR